MNHILMIKRLKKQGIPFAPGLSDDEIKRIEETFGFRFPKEIAEFFSYAYPENEYFFDYRDMSEENIQYFLDFQQRIKEMFLFDIEKNEESLQELLSDIAGSCSDHENFKTAVLTALEQSPKLIPFFQHRCFFDGIDGLPIVSFWQPVDTIFYGSDLENYLENEFLVPHGGKLGVISDKIKETGIWYQLIE